MNKFEWEVIQREDCMGITYRAKCPGGWIVRYYDFTDGVTMVFIPDTHHAWKLECP